MGAMSTMLEAALRYAEQRLPIFPCSAKDKAPLVARGFHAATTDAATIKSWWTRWPNAMIGMPTGPASGVDVLDLDLDDKKGKDGFAALPDWQSRSPIIVRTPRGGAHLWFKSEGTLRNSADDIALGVDTRGAGGYAIVPPSQNGAAAYWFEKGGAGGVAGLPPFPADLLARLQVDDAPRGASNANPEAPIELVTLATLVIPNKDVGWDEWARIGMAIWRATGGEGFEAFDNWSRKSTKYDEKETREKWRQYFNSRPDRIGAGTLFYLANEALPGWDKDFHDALVKRLNTADNGETVAWLEANFWNKAEASTKRETEEPHPEEEAPKEEAPKAKSNSGLEIVRVADVEAKKVDWLWKPRIARGKLTILAGMPDVNKSTLTLDLAARVTTGGILPCGEGHVPLGNVIILSAEDDIADTVRPRLEVAGADLTHVHIITAIKASHGRGPRSFDLTQDIDRLEEAVQEIGDVPLIVIDPVSAYMGKPGKLDSYRSTDVRATLSPLQEMAARCGAAVIGIDHLNKSGGAQAMVRVIGSIAFVAAARAVYVVVRDDEDDERRLFLPAKNNLGKIRTGLAFRVIEKLAPPPVFDAYPAIKWESEAVTMTADEALAKRPDGRKSEDAEAAKVLIAEMLAEKAAPQKEIEARAEAQGISHRSLQTAKKALGIVSTKIGIVWFWSRPGQERPF